MAFCSAEDVCFWLFDGDLLKKKRKYKWKVFFLRWEGSYSQFWALQGRDLGMVDYKLEPKG